MPPRPARIAPNERTRTSVYSAPTTGLVFCAAPRPLRGNSRTWFQRPVGRSAHVTNANAPSSGCQCRRPQEQARSNGLRRSGQERLLGHGGKKPDRAPRMVDRAAGSQLDVRMGRRRERSPGQSVGASGRTDVAHDRLRRVGKKSARRPLSLGEHGISCHRCVVRQCRNPKRNELFGGRALELTESEIETTASVHLSALFIPHVLQLAGECAVIKVTSGLAFVPLMSVPVHCATKSS